MYNFVQWKSIEKWDEMMRHACINIVLWAIYKSNHLRVVPTPVAIGSAAVCSRNMQQVSKDRAP